MKVVRASDAWRLLNGLFCVHKPTDMPMDRMKMKIREALCKDLNQLEIRPPGLYHRPVFKEHPDSGELLVVGHVTQLNYADHPAVVGDRYQVEEIHLEAADALHKVTSGLCVFGINDGCDLLPKLREARLMKVYYIRGRLGRATLDCTEESKILEKTTFNHVTPHRMAKVLSRVLSGFQIRSFESAGVNIQSQEAYELASRGMVRPKEDSHTILYGAKCVGMQLPYFTLEVQCVNETDEFFPQFVHELGLSLRSTACLSALRRMRHGHLTLADHALLEKHWTLEHILNNIELCRQLLSPSLLKPSQLLGMDRMISTENTKYIDSIPSDFDPEYMTDGRDEETCLERSLLEDRGLIEERFSNTKSTVPLDSVPDCGESDD